MARDPLNLTGDWDGVFSYPQDKMPSTPFLATITDSAGHISGTTMEPDLYADGPAHAQLIGVRSGTSIDFTKTYQSRSVGYSSPVDYVGRISEDGQVITGSWTMQSWSGSFEMVRQAQFEAEEEAHETAEV